MYSSRRPLILRKPDVYYLSREGTDKSAKLFYIFKKKICTGSCWWINQANETGLGCRRRCIPLPSSSALDLLPPNKHIQIFDKYYETNICLTFYNYDTKKKRDSVAGDDASPHLSSSALDLFPPYKYNKYLTNIMRQMFVSYFTIMKQNIARGTTDPGY